MRCVHLSCQHFRNLTDVQLFLNAGTTVFLGDNGQGKTNVLEGLWLLSRGRSQRTANDRELIEWCEGVEAGQTPYKATLTGRFLPDDNAGSTAGDASLTINAQWWVENNRLRSRWQVNGVTLASRAKLVGLVPTVGFFVSDLELLRGGPSDRRHWLDSALVQYQPSLMAHLQRFESIRKQKSELLKQLGGHTNQPQRDNLVLWNEQFASAATAVIYGRQQYLTKLVPTVMAQYEAIADGAEALTLTYANAEYEGLSEGDINRKIREELQAKQREEIVRQRCVIGPHRDDVQLYLNGRDATAYASQGQQRSIVIALKLGEVATLAQARETQPILLLDDVMAELDTKRQRYLLGQLGGQVWLTTTHLPSLASDSPLTGLLHQPVDDATAGDGTNDYSIDIIHLRQGQIIQPEAPASTTLKSDEVIYAS